MAIVAPNQTTSLGFTEGAAVAVFVPCLLHTHPGRLDEVVARQVASICDVMPFVEDTVKVVRQRQLAAVANARQMQIEQELAMCGPPVLQLVVVEQHLAWQQLPFHRFCSQQLPSHHT